MIVVVLVAALLIAVVMLVFAIFNGTPVTVNLIFVQIPTQLSLATLIPFVAGVLVGWLFTVPGSIKNTLTIAGHKRRIDSLEKEKSMAAKSSPPVGAAAPARDMPQPAATSSARPTPPPSMPPPASAPSRPSAVPSPGATSTPPPTTSAPSPGRVPGTSSSDDEPD